MFKNKLTLTLFTIASLGLTSQAIAVITTSDSYIYAHPGATIPIDLTQMARSTSPITSISINSSNLEGELEYSNTSTRCEYNAPLNPRKTVTGFQYMLHNEQDETSNPATLTIYFGGHQN